MMTDIGPDGPPGQSLINKNELNLAAMWQVSKPVSSKNKTHLFVDQDLTQSNNE